MPSLECFSPQIWRTVLLVSTDSFAIKVADQRDERGDYEKEGWRWC